MARREEGIDAPAQSRLLALLRRCRDDREPVPSNTVISRTLGIDAASAFLQLKKAGVVRTSVEAGGRRVVFMVEGGEAYGRRQDHRPAETLYRFRALYQHVAGLADTGSPMPTIGRLGTLFRCDAYDALKWCAKAGLITYETQRGVGAAVTITATGKVAAPRPRQKNAGAGARIRRPYAHAGVVPTQSVWGDLAPVVDFLRNDGDTIERVGVRKVQACVNGELMSLDAMAGRADRIRDRRRRERAAGALYAAVY